MVVYLQGIVPNGLQSKIEIVLNYPVKGVRQVPSPSSLRAAGLGVFRVTSRSYVFQPSSSCPHAPVSPNRPYGCVFSK